MPHQRSSKPFPEGGWMGVGFDSSMACWVESPRKGLLASSVPDRSRCSYKGLGGGYLS